MGFRVKINASAVADLAGIVSYVAADHPEAATRLGNALLDAAFSLSAAPFKGSRYPKFADVRRITLPPYKIFYRVEEADQVVEILRFWHSSRSDPDFP
jgi:plasmid stabilization system protein ParE